MRKLATIREIKEIVPIEGADRIELATVDGWKVVVAKNVGHKIGDKIVYCEIDSFLPVRDDFEFLRKGSYKKLPDGTEGFRLKTIKLRGQISQGLILPYSVIGEGEIGDDVTEKLGIIKYEPPVPASLSGKVKGNFPSFIQKTDEERIQNLSKFFEKYREFKYFVTEKLDGTSFTGYLNDSNFGVCSRNWDVEFTEDNTYWKVAKEISLEERLKSIGRNLAIQGELIGEGIQGNRYKVLGHELRVFNIFDIDKFEYVSKNEKMDLVEELDLKSVPVIETEMIIPPTMDEILEFAIDKSVLNENAEREGLVWVSINSPERISFKTISNKFLNEGGH